MGCSKINKGVVRICDSCNPCEADSNVRLCAFIVPTLEEGRYYKNSFVFVQEDNTAYYISEDRSEIPFGSRPVFIDDFDPATAEVEYHDTIVYDTKNMLSYVYASDGSYVKVSLLGSMLNAGEGIDITLDPDGQTVAIDPEVVATVAALDAEAQARQLADGNLEMSISQVAAQVDNETDARIQADNGLQSQIDAIVNSSDVKDVVGTKAELDAYPTATLGKNDIVKVLNDESQNGATTYYRWDGTKFDPVGSVGPYYTKAEADAKLAPVSSQVETNTSDISEALGQIAALDADKLGLDNLLAGAGISISKDGEGHDATLTLTAEGGGGDPVYHISTADYNYSSSFAHWLAEPGIYVVDEYMNIRSYSNGAFSLSVGDSFVVLHRGSQSWLLLAESGRVKIEVTNLTGGRVISDSYLLSKDMIVDSLTSTSMTSPLSANQGKVLGDRVTALEEGGGGGGGGIRTLTKDDYDWPTNAPDGIATWKLPAGMYVGPTDSSVKLYTTVGLSRSLSGSSSYDHPSSIAVIKYAGYSYTITAGGSISLYLDVADGQTGQPANSNPSSAGLLLLTSAYIEDNLTTTRTDRILSANQGKLLNDRVTALEEGGGGGGDAVYHLTAADYNWPTNSPDAVAPWVLPAGSYVADETINFYQAGLRKSLYKGEMVVVFKDGFSGGATSVIQLITGSNELMYYRYNNYNGSTAYAGKLITTQNIANNYDTLSTDFALSAPKGKDLNDRLTALEQGGGSSVEVVQTTGTSETAVMSQKAVTDIVKASTVALGTNSKAKSTASIAIGTNTDSNNGEGNTALGTSAVSYQTRSTALGAYAQATAAYSVAVGSESWATVAGTVSFGGTGLGTNGYNGSQYRLLTNVYDPQDDHDAATKGYVDAAVANAGGEAMTVEEFNEAWA